MVKIGEITVEISASTSKLRANLAQASSLIRDFSLLSQGLTGGISEAFRQISAVAIRGLQISLFALVGTFTLAARVGAEFQDEMMRAFTILKEGGNAATGSLSRMTSSALNLGRDTLFSAVQAAQGMQILARAGFNTTEILSSIRPTLDLAIVGNMELAETTNIVISALRGFNLETREAGRVSDILALGSSKANTTIKELGTALSYVAPVAAGAGLAIEETVAAIGILSNAGIRGGRAGTTLRRALSQLLAPSRKAKKVMDELGVSFVSSEGKLKPFVSIVRDLEKAGMNASQAMEMFGLRAGPGMIALVNAGASSVSQLSNSLEQAQGTAEDMSQAFRTTVKGRVRDLTASVIDLGLAFSENFKKPLADAIFSFRNFIVNIVNVGNRMGVFRAIIKGVKSSLEPITDLISTLADKFKKWVSELTPRKVSKFFSDLREDIDAFVKSLTTGEIGAIIKDTFNVIIGLGSILIGTIKGISNAWMLIPEGIRDSIRPMLIIGLLILQMFGGLMNIVFLIVSLNALWASLGVTISASALLTAGLLGALLVVGKIVLIIGIAIAAWKLGGFIGELSIVKGYFTAMVLMAQSIGPSLKLAAMSILTMQQPWRLFNKEFRADMAETIEEVKIKTDALKEIDWLGKNDKKNEAVDGKSKDVSIGSSGGLIGPDGKVITVETIKLMDEITALKDSINLERGKVGPGKVTENLIDLVKKLIDKENKMSDEYSVLNNRVNAMMGQTVGKTNEAVTKQPMINSGLNE